MDSGTKMIFISHRGNIDGPNEESENNPSYIDLAIDEGFDVEIDLWMVGSKLYLGHDEPDIKIDENFLLDRESVLWVHCKNGAALDFAANNYLNCFFHDTDDYTITSAGFVWAYPGKDRASDHCIMVKPEFFNFPSTENYAGVCSDYIRKIRQDVQGS